jgi:hypothetical protein
MAIALVTGQSAYGTAAATTVNAVLPNNPATGNFVVACVLTSNNSATLAVHDSIPNTYTASSKTPFSSSTPVFRSGIFYLPNVPAGATKTITFTGSVSGTMEIWVAEFSGVTTTTPFENDATNNGTVAGTAINLPTYTTLNAGDLLVAVAGVSGAISTANSPWTGWPGGVPASGDYAEYFIQSAAGAQAISFTASSSTWNAIEAAFKASAVVDVLRAMQWM